MTIELLDHIWVNLINTGVRMETFVTEVRLHDGKFTNFLGFIRDLSKTFGRKTAASPPPVTASEASARDYKCSECFSLVPGQGANPIGGGKFVPCVCASPEWVEAQRARGVFGLDGGSAGRESAVPSLVLVGGR
jgi:hypothetical protein